jgi:class 3 adenylate cyclase
LAAGKGFDFQLRGEVRLKGFQEAERVWRASRRVVTSSATPQTEG